MIQRAYLSYGSKIEIIERQCGKCNRCDHIIHFRVKATTCVDTATGEVKSYWGNHHQNSHEKLIEKWIGYPLLDIEFHHTIPLVEGGGNSISNFEALCYDCHLKVHNRRRLD